MEDLFVSYELALQLKTKGFNEDCFTLFDEQGLLDNYWDLDNEEFIYNQSIKDLHLPKRNSETKNVTAPLYDQVIEWLRDVHNIHVHPNFYMNRFSNLMDYEYQVHYRVDNKWQCMKITAEDSRSNAIYQALKLF